MSSEKQLLANQQNAQKSTGPKTAEGKTRSRRNALKHGLAGGGVVLNRADDAALAAKLKELNEHLEPIDVLERNLVTRVAIATIQMEKCVRKDRAETARRQRRALWRWEEKQHLAVADILEQFEDRPAEAVAALCSTSYGCDCLMDEWQELEQELIAPDHWTSEQTLHAMRLFGQDPSLSIDQLDGPGVVIMRHARHLGTAEGATREATIQAMQAIMAAERVRLQALRDRLWNEEEKPTRTEVEDVAGVDTSDKGARLHGYEKSHELSMHRNLKRLIDLRKIEPEHQSVARWHKTGKLKPRRWDGTNYAPTNPYFTPMPGVGAGSQGTGDGQQEAQGPGAAARPVNEANSSSASHEGTCSSGTPTGRATGVHNPVSGAPGAVQRPVSMAPKHAQEPPTGGSVQS
ncbi:MAG TPA: hypothetical protein VGZ22_05995 [Isosphaeraceae bacterium]|nr:hypothetical protein [Isosphaeraceae bacterium]